MSDSQIILHRDGHRWPATWGTNAPPGEPVVLTIHTILERGDHLTFGPLIWHDRISCAIRIPSRDLLVRDIEVPLQPDCPACGSREPHDIDIHTRLSPVLRTCIVCDTSWQQPIPPPPNDPGPCTPPF